MRGGILSVRSSLSPRGEEAWTVEAGERERFGPYALLEKLGEGGLGEAWEALDTRLERVVPWTPR